MLAQEQLVEYVVFRTNVVDKTVVVDEYDRGLQLCACQRCGDS